MHYFLMNKSTPLLLFSCARNEFNEVVCEEREWYSERRPYGYQNLTDYLLSRQAPKHRKHITELLCRYGCDDLEGFLTLTHALSLNDTFWVREADSSALQWETVSLYRNPFDDLISLAAFDGSFVSTSLSSTSPEFGTDGNFAKCWVREEEKIMLYKSGSSTFEIEPLSEYLACQVASVICPHHVAYDLAFYHDRLISKCELFTSEDVGLVKASSLLSGRERSMASIWKRFDSDDFRRMCVLDALILNTDRHLGNFGVLVENDTGRLFGMAPVFDHNRSLLFDMDINQLDWGVQVCKPRIGADFISTARGLMTDAIRKDLLTLEDFSFTQHPIIKISEARLEKLSAIVRGQVKEIL